MIAHTCQVLVLPDWDERYLTCFGYSFDRTGTAAVRSLQSKMRAAGLALDTLPGPPVMPRGLSAGELATRGRALVRAGLSGARDGPTRRDPDALALLFDTMARSIDTGHGLARETTFQWEFTDPDVPAWHLTVSDATAHAAPGAARRADLRLRVSYQDWVDVVARRLSLARAIACGRLRPRGNPLGLAKLARVYPQV